MTAAQTIDYPKTAPPEPFGQAGVRQYAGRLIAWVFLTAGLCAMAMGQRSSSFADRLNWKGQGQSIDVESGNGQLVVRAESNEKFKGDGGWSYRGGYNSNRYTNRNPWASSFGETLGLEGAMAASDPEADRGFWFRLKWSTLATLLLVQPVAFVIRRLVRRLRDRDGEDAAAA